MMALLEIILFATTDIYEKVKIRQLKCIRTMLRVYADNRHFPKNSLFFHNFI
jgi:hypothetical protein